MAEGIADERKINMSYIKNPFYWLSLVVSCTIDGDYIHVTRLMTLGVD